MDRNQFIQREDHAFREFAKRSGFQSDLRTGYESGVSLVRKYECPCGNVTHTPGRAWDHAQSCHHACATGDAHLVAGGI